MRTNVVSNVVGDLFYDAFRASPIGIVLEDLDGRLLFANPAFCSLVGLSEDEVLRKQCVEFSPGDDSERDWALFRRLRSGEIEHYQLDKRYFRRDGSTFWGRLSISLLNHRPSPLVIAVVQDISEKVIAQETLELATQEMVGVTRCSRDFRYQWVSPGFARFVQKPVEEIIGRAIIDITGESRFQDLKPYFDRVLAGETVSFEASTVLDALRPRWVSATYTPVRNASGDTDGWVGVVVDITERRKAQDEHVRHALLVESSDDAIFSMDLDGRIQSWNRGAQRLFGYTEGEAVAQGISIVVPEEFRREEQAVLACVRRDEPVRRYETQRLTKGGGRLDVAVTMSPIRDAAGTILGACCIDRDITDRKRFERSLLWRLDFERLLSDLSRRFISLREGEIDLHVTQALARVGSFLAVDRITLYTLSPARTEFFIAYNWSASGVDRGRRPLFVLDVPWWASRVLRGEISLASTPDDLPDAATAEREFFARGGIVSAASIPLNVAGEVIGAISFVTLTREVRWTDDLVHQLRIIGDIFSNALTRKRAMEELRSAEGVTRESEERFRLVANSAPAMIWMSGTDAQRTYVNQSWLAYTGRPVEAELGQGWVEAVHAEDSARCWATFTDALDRREPFQMEYRLRRHDDTYRWLLDYGVPRFNPDGTCAGYIGSCVDVTDRREAEALRSAFSRRLIQAQEEERAAVGRELHDDINQRVVLASLNLEALKRDVVDDHTRQEVAAVIQQLNELGQDIQALSHRLHSAKLERLGLTAAADAFLREVAAKHNIQIAFRSAGVPVDLQNEIALCLFRVLQEGIQNSTKHSSATQLNVTLTADDQEVQLLVEDSGKGFDVAEAMKGNGIGLANMRERLRLVRGRLNIESRPGGGTCVRARVPLGARDSSASVQ